MVSELYFVDNSWQWKMIADHCQTVFDTQASEEIGNGLASMKID